MGENEENHEDKTFLEFVVKSLVKNPEDVIVEKKIDERGVLLTIKLNQADVGSIVGKQGQTIGAIRRLIGIIGSKNNIMTSVRVHDERDTNRDFNPGN